MSHTRIDPAPRDEHDLCTCAHEAHRHTAGTGSCQANDSYDQPCECPSFERDTSLDDDPDDDT